MDKECLMLRGTLMTIGVWVDKYSLGLLDNICLQYYNIISSIVIYYTPARNETEDMKKILGRIALPCLLLALVLPLSVLLVTAKPVDAG